MTWSLPASEDQREVIEFLSHPAAYGLRDSVVERIETHCSIVFLVADRAYKLKRAIRYASLDYTTRASRQAACKAELVLNRRTAPEIYLAVHSINSDANGALTFDGPGITLDHVVVMRRFPQADLFDQMAEHGMLTPRLMHQLGESVARFHLAAEATPEHGGAGAIAAVIADNDRELALVASSLDGGSVALLGGSARAELDRVADLLDRRRLEGKVRHGHGDLRLANICLYSGRPTLFDCIEFSDQISCIDVLYDLSFLLMDLQLCGRGDLGNMVFNAYLDLAPEIDGLRTLPLFLALRAATRSYALVGSATRQETPRQARRKLALARQHIRAGIDFLSPASPLLIVLGSRMDQERADLAALLAGAVPPAPGARLLPLRLSPDMVWRETAGLLAAGCSVLVEGTFTEESELRVAAELAARLDVRRLGLWLGALPNRLDGRDWWSLDSSHGALAALASAIPLLTTQTTARQQVAARLV